MFLCGKCHTSKTCFHFSGSTGPCEDCGKVGPCVDCHEHNPAPRKKRKAVKKKKK